MTRKEEIMQAVNDNKTLLPLIDDMVYLERQLEQLRALPKIKVDPENDQRQKATPAAKMYKEYLQQYVNVVKVIQKATGADGEGDDSPLSKWMRTYEVECR